VVENWGVLYSTLNNLSIDEFWDNFYKSKFNLLNVA